MSLSRRVTRCLVRMGIIEKRDWDIYEYSINTLFEMLTNILLTIIMGIMLDKLVLTILFLGIVVPVRSFIGGCHAKTAIRCFCLSILVYLICIISPTYLLEVPNWIYILIVFVSGGIICWWAPVDCVQKPISMGERERMALCSKISVLIICVLFAIITGMGEKTLAIEISLIMMYFVLTLMIEKLRKRRV